MTPYSLTCTDVSVLSDIFTHPKKENKKENVHRYILLKISICFICALWFMYVFGKTKNEWNYNSTPHELHRI